MSRLARVGLSQAAIALAGYNQIGSKANTMPATKPKSPADTPKLTATTTAKPRPRRKRSTITLATLATRLDELAAGQRAMEASMREVLHNLQIAQFASVPCDDYTQRLIAQADDDPSPSIPWEQVKSELGL